MLRRETHLARQDVKRVSSSLAASLANGEALLSGQRRAEEEGRELRAAMMAMMDGEKIKREDE